MKLPAGSRNLAETKAGAPEGVLRVAFVIDSLGAGGAERSLTDLLPLLRREGIAPLVICLTSRPVGFEDEVQAMGVEVRFLGTAGRIGRVLALRRVLQAERPHLVYTALFEADITGRLAAATTRVPVVTNLVNTTYDPVRLGDPNVSAWKLRAARLLDGWTARHLTAHFHAISEAVKQAAVKSLGIPPERISVIARGRDPDRFRPAEAERRRWARHGLGIEEDQTVLINVGRQEFQKGQSFLLEAMAILTRKRPRLLLLLIGREGRSSAGLRESVENLGLSDHVRFLGHRKDVPDLLVAGDLFVLPSLYEGLAGAVIEAMACGLPIVASDLLALREVVEPGGNAILVPSGQATPLADAISRLLDAPASLRSFGLRSRELFEERFTLEAIAADTVRMLREVAGRRVSPSSASARFRPQ